MFDTETMAELCVKQGLFDQAITIFERMASESQDPAQRLRYQQRIVALEQRPGHAPLGTPGLRVQTAGGEVQIEWRLPPEIEAPALQLLLLLRTPDGIEVEARTVPVGAPHGRTTIVTPNLHSARAAAGRLVGGSFVPVVRLPSLSLSDPV